ncbi:MAG: tRNA uridine-5-carboxymethylaminomethyl(34) synthesis GTPase MnmE, partial [Clostridia bacterium]
MSMSSTIAAIATPPGMGGIAIVRVSGPLSTSILFQLFRSTACAKGFESHHLYYGHIVDGDETLDEAMAVLMQAPRSFTREDVAEFHCHGGDVTCHRVLSAVLAHGARMAEPGEFTRRAFENGRIDLSQAEAAMQLISASGEAAARAALRQLSGALGRFVKDAQTRLTRMLAALEAAIDFPDEVEETLTCAQVREEAQALAQMLRQACDARTGRWLSQGFSVVIAGRPNVGKSSLLNALLGEERAIVTAQPGTTRDAVTGSLMLHGLRVDLTDTAGLREASDPAEAMGVSRARRIMAEADLLLLVLDASEPLDMQDEALLRDSVTCPRAVLLNKGDLPVSLTPAHIAALAPDADVLLLSAQTAQGLDALRALLWRYAGLSTGETAPITHVRHIQAAQDAAHALDD